MVTDTGNLAGGIRQGEVQPPVKVIDANIFRRNFLGNIRVYHPKAKVFKTKLQSCYDVTKVGLIIYIHHNLQVQELVQNVIKVIKQGHGHVAEIAMQSEAYNQTD